MVMIVLNYTQSKIRLSSKPSCGAGSEPADSTAPLVLKTGTPGSPKSFTAGSEMRSSGIIVLYFRHISGPW